MSDYSAALTADETQQVLEQSEKSGRSRARRPDSLPPGLLRELTRLSPIRTVGWLALNWGSVFAVAWAFEAWLHWLFYPLVALYIGSRQVALLVLMHDAAHNLLFRNKRLNDIVGEMLTAWPMFASMHAYRRIHFAHHRNLNTDLDPDYTRNRPWELEKVETWKDFFLKITGLKGGEGVKALATFASETEGERSWKIGRIAYYAAIASTLTFAGAWPEFGLYWVVPFAWCLARRRLHGIAEHWAVPDREPLNQSRTVIHNPFEKLVFSPHNSGLHLEHHLYPCVPWYHLPRVHEALMENAEYRERAAISHGLVDVAREVLATPSWRRAQIARH